MSRAELMAKMTPHGIVISGQGFGGTPAISAIDVAGALGMGRLSRPAYLFGLLKYTGDTAAASSVYRITTEQVEALATGEGWNVSSHELAQLVGMAIRENMHAAVCPACNGSGVVAAKECGECHGIGRLATSNRERARLFGVPETTWRRQWRERADRCYRIVQAWDADVVRHLAWQFMPDHMRGDMITPEMAGC